MIHRLPITTTNNAPANNMKASALQIVACKNAIPSHSPNKEINTPRRLDLSNTFQEKIMGKGPRSLL